ncbi:MAG: two-component system response regulator NarL [Halioglobus sp.]|nr:two-component system response regulator NarL [Halioglobus sp.]
MISILLVDDHPMLRQGVAQLIELEEGLMVVGQAGSGEEALHLAAQLDPDMVLLDLNMQGMNGIATLQALREQGFNACVMVFTVSDQHDDVVAALRAGADGYLLKDTEPEVLLQSIKAASQGQPVFSPQLARVLASGVRDQKADSAERMGELTGREAQILQCIAQGKTNKRIARELAIAEATVKVHVKNTLKKLGLRSRVEAAVWVLENRVFE